jgi:protein O-GlcNAc transferase
MCEWGRRKEDFSGLLALLDEQLSSDNFVVPCVQPFHALTYGLEPAKILQIASMFAEKSRMNVSLLEIPTFHWRHRSSGSRIKIGYVSSDFGNHPVSHLMSSMYGLHNKEQFEVFCYALNSDDQSEWRARIQDGVEHFKDVSSLQAGDVATLIHSDGVMVLFNLNGYTRGAKNEIFSLQPAPIQINMGGYVGTSGASYMDFIVGDEVVTGEERAGNFSEHIISMPGSFLVNDHKRSYGFALERGLLSRESYGLSEDDFIFACFNQM